MVGRSHLDCFGATDVGRKRLANEDQFMIGDIRERLAIRASSAAQDHVPPSNNICGQHLLLVADGMGGHAAGQWASRLAVDELHRHLSAQLPWPTRANENLDVEPCAALVAGLKQCHARIVADASAHPERAGMGTTMTVAMVMWPWTYLAHVGDSRCYLLRGTQLRQLTTDHTVAYQLVQRGVLTPDSARYSSLNRVLWNVLGGSGDTDLEPETLAFKAETGDTLLLCSDGLTGHLTDEQIRVVLGQTRSAKEACWQLVNMANEAGGSDNVTAVVARFCADATGGVSSTALHQHNQVEGTKGRRAINPTFAADEASRPTIDSLREVS